MFKDVQSKKSNVAAHLSPSLQSSRDSWDYRNDSSTSAC